MRFLVIFLLLTLAGCIPDSALDADWCRSLEAAKVDAGQQEKANLTSAMVKHNCTAKLLRDARLQP